MASDDENGTVDAGNRGRDAHIGQWRQLLPAPGAAAAREAPEFPAELARPLRDLVRTENRGEQIEVVAQGDPLGPSHWHRSGGQVLVLPGRRVEQPGSVTDVVGPAARHLRSDSAQDPAAHDALSLILQHVTHGCALFPGYVAYDHTLGSADEAEGRQKPYSDAGNSIPHRTPPALALEVPRPAIT